MIRVYFWHTPTEWLKSNHWLLECALDIFCWDLWCVCIYQIMIIRLLQVSSSYHSICSKLIAFLQMLHLWAFQYWYQYVGLKQHTPGYGYCPSTFNTLYYSDVLVPVRGQEFRSTSYLKNLSLVFQSEIIVEADIRAESLKDSTQ